MEFVEGTSIIEHCDAKRMGVTGRSGGGATSWWVAAADERVKVVIPVAGIADLRAHLSEGYPGRLEVRVTYRVTGPAELSVSFEASTDRSTIVNLTRVASSRPGSPTSMNV